MPPHEPPQISVIVPVWNEANTMAPLFQELRAVLDTLGQAYEILAIDDGSQDGTGAALLALPFVRTLVYPYNKGNGAAVKTGIRHILLLHKRYTSFSILFILTGVLIFCIGLVSEQIAMLRFERLNQDR
jgi:glycosyltransferase involved in cell wall biosynthesis